MPTNLNPFEVWWTKLNDGQARLFRTNPRAVAALISYLSPDAEFICRPWAGAARASPAGKPRNVTAAAAASVFNSCSWAIEVIDTTPRPQLLHAGLADNRGAHVWTVIDLDTETEYFLPNGPSPASVFAKLESQQG